MEFNMDELKNSIKEVISEMNDKSQAYETTISELNEKIEAKDSEISEKDNTISELNASVEKIQAEHVRVGDLTKLDGQIVEVYGDEVPEDAFAKDVKLEADADGSLKKNDSATAPYFQVTSVIGNKLGIKVKVVASAE